MSRLNAERQREIIADLKAQTEAARRRRNIAALHQVGAPRAYWIIIPRETWDGEPLPNYVIGPYPDADAARLAMDESLLVNGIMEDTKRDFSVTDDVYFIGPVAAPKGEHIIIDMSEPDYTGRYAS